MRYPSRSPICKPNRVKNSFFLQQSNIDFVFHGSYFSIVLLFEFIRKVLSNFSSRGVILKVEWTIYFNFSRFLRLFWHVAHELHSLTYGKKTLQFWLSATRAHVCGLLVSHGCDGLGLYFSLELIGTKRNKWCRELISQPFLSSSQSPFLFTHAPSLSHPSCHTLLKAP